MIMFDFSFLRTWCNDVVTHYVQNSAASVAFFDTFWCFFLFYDKIFCYSFLAKLLLYSDIYLKCQHFIQWLCYYVASWLACQPNRI